MTLKDTSLLHAEIRELNEARFALDLSYLAIANEIRISERRLMQLMKASSPRVAVHDRTARKVRDFLARHREQVRAMLAKGAA